MLNIQCLYGLITAVKRQKKIVCFGIFVFTVLIYYNIYKKHPMYHIQSRGHATSKEAQIFARKSELSAAAINKTISLEKQASIKKSFTPTSVATFIVTDVATKIKDELSSVATIRQQREELWKKIEMSLIDEKKMKRYPKIIGIGTEKCGTHALLHFLKPHLLIKRTYPMELHYFESHSYSHPDLYLNKMPLARSSEFIMEKTPAYFSFPPYEMAENIKKVVPNAKLLLIVCDPSKRAFSDFVHEKVLFEVTNKRIGLDTKKTFDEFLDVYIPKITTAVGNFNNWKKETVELKEKKVLQLHKADYATTVLTTGFYALHLQRWLKADLYDKSNLLIVDGGKMMEDPGSIVEEVETFLQLPKLLLRDDYVRDHKTGYFCYKDWRDNDKLLCLPKSKQRTRNGMKQISNETLSRLESFYKSHNEALCDMLGRQFSWN